jgi:hypothetical protein
MAYSFPLSVTDFMRALPIAEISFDAPEQVEVNQTAGGEIITADLAPMLWQGEVRLGTMTHAEASHADVMLDLLRPAGRMFYAYDTRRPAPLADPSGLILGSTVPTIASLISGNRELTLAGLPAWYVLSRGDYLAFDYGEPPCSQGGLEQAQQHHGCDRITPMIRPGAPGIGHACGPLPCPAGSQRRLKGQASTITRDASFHSSRVCGREAILRPTPTFRPATASPVLWVQARNRSTGCRDDDAGPRRPGFHNRGDTRTYRRGRQATAL